MVRADRRAEHRSPPLAICGFGGEKGPPRAKLEYRGMGRNCSQDCAPDSNDEEQDSYPLPMEPCRLMAEVPQRFAQSQSFLRPVAAQYQNRRNQSYMDTITSLVKH